MNIRLKDYAQHLHRIAAGEMAKIVEGSLNAAMLRAVGLGGGAGGTTKRGKVVAAGSSGWVRKATPVFTGLLSRSFRGQSSADRMRLFNAEISGPRYLNSPNGPQKNVADYADVVGAKHGIQEQVQKFMRRSARQMIQAAITRRLRALDKGTGTGI